jgi:RNA polymerase sigma-70 factor (ECF subfamily)
MAQLEEEYRLALTLRVVEDLSYEQIGEVLDVKVGTVKSRIARARERLKKILLQNGNNFGNISSNPKERGRDHEM